MKTSTTILIKICVKNSTFMKLKDIFTSLIAAFTSFFRKNVINENMFYYTKGIELNKIIKIKNVSKSNLHFINNSCIFVCLTTNTLYCSKKCNIHLIYINK